MQSFVEKIKKVKQEKDVVILAHYYVEDSVQEIADYVGDSYYLSKKASEVPQNNILFCGVSFMGESAKIMNPQKTVLMADALADCPMAHMVEIHKIEQVRQEYSDVAVVCYINSTAEIKAHSDVCVTSSNALKIVSALPEKNIFFIPDSNLGRYIAEKLPDKNFIFHDGYCHVHTSITKEQVLKVKQEHPNAKILVHPECTPEVVSLGDYIGSTSGIIDFATSNSASEYIICTELGIFYELQKKNPNKKFFPATQHQFCPDMKRINLEKINQVLETFENPLELEESFRKKAEKPLLRMHEIAK